METEIKCRPKVKVGSDTMYGMGFIGAAIYYISIAHGFWMGVLGFLKAIIWPVFFVYDALKFLQASGKLLQ
jgi:hypothetical protein